ncbi:response regulator transcription factor [Actinomadura graeca]|uniref:Response regulator transcription factor n=1 Tax=Actinomadura graeca TaxID=2750812 RepID=A0ABX8QWT3_9ACTN|nr:response regulator transcription factor [Actinomadura graeca]QXJ22192.1 response regulator transcription factor [Actinomadura graeca]
MRILLVEDDDTIAEPLVDGLGRYGFTVEHVRTGAGALAHPGADMVLLDLGLPDIDGIDVCRRLRTASDVPVIMLSARGTETDRVVGLELGADDYLAKPFGLRELVARIRAVARRTRPGPADLGRPHRPGGSHAGAGQAEDGGHIVRTGRLTIDRRTRQVRVAGQEVELAPKEYDLLALLAEDAGAVYTRQQIIEVVWDPYFVGSTKTLDFHVAALRRKLGDAAWVQTIRGVGFRLTDPAVPAVAGSHTASDS